MKRLLYIDLFCGAGGTSTGVNSARLNGEQCADVIACVNHDANAIASHASNHPDALHFTEDIRTLELSPLVEHLKNAVRRTPVRWLFYGHRLNVPTSRKQRAVSHGMPTAGHLRNTSSAILKP